MLPGMQRCIFRAVHLAFLCAGRRPCEEQLEMNLRNTSAWALDSISFDWAWSVSWSEVPFKSLWYGLQLCAKIRAAFIIAVAATPRQIVRGVFIAMALIVVASIASGRKGASAVRRLLVGVTGGKTARRFRHGPALRSAVPMMSVGAYIATHVEAATAKASVLAFPLVFFVNGARRWPAQWIEFPIWAGLY
jgi:hypothetical protein